MSESGDDIALAYAVLWSSDLLPTGLAYQKNQCATYHVLELPGNHMKLI